MHVAVDMYLQLLCLFVAGDTSAMLTPASRSQEPQGQAGAGPGPCRQTASSLGPGDRDSASQHMWPLTCALPVPSRPKTLWA